MNGRLFHLDCPSGLAGDMFLGACIDLGMPLEVVQLAVEQLDLESFGTPGVTVQAHRSQRGGISGMRFRVLQSGSPIEGPDPEEGARLSAGPATASGLTAHAAHEHQKHAAHSHDAAHRTWAQIRTLVETSTLDSRVKELALRLFARLAEVEGSIHGIEPERVHFHEVGAVDSIVDIVGAAAAFVWLAPQRLTCGTVVVGSGTIDTEHGVLPVPAPATARLLEGMAIAPGPEGELVTPTGALLLAELVEAHQAAPRMILEGQGYGLGRWDLPGRANAVRLLRGASVDGGSLDLGESSGGGERERGRVCVIECQLDDLPGEGFGYLLERLMEEGALDVYYTPVQMKKGRPGVHVTVLGRPEQLEMLAGLLMTESGSLGCRYREMTRLEASREQVEVETPWGRVRCKRATLAGRTLATSPEFDDCSALARRHGVPWRDVHRAALVAVAALETASKKERT